MARQAEEDSMRVHQSTVVITGATSGIGRATARALVRGGAQVVVVGRASGSPERVAEALRSESPSASVSWAVADLSRMEEVRGLAADLLRRFPRIQALVNNAGGIFFTRQETPEGIERTWALNVLSPFLLSNLLLPALVAGAPARVVNISSEAHRTGKIRWEDLEGRGRYSGWRAYGQSKLALLLVTYELARRWAGTGVVVNAVHPGFVRSGFGHNNPGLRGGALRFAEGLFAISPDRAARVVAPLVLDPGWNGITGRYIRRHRVVRSSRPSMDPAAAARLVQFLSRQAGLSISSPGSPSVPTLG